MAISRSAGESRMVSYANGKLFVRTTSVEWWPFWLQLLLRSMPTCCYFWSSETTQITTQTTIHLRGLLSKETAGTS